MLAKTKRLLAMVLTVCLVMGFIPVSAGASNDVSSEQIYQDQAGNYLYYPHGQGGFGTAGVNAKVDNNPSNGAAKVEISKTIAKTQTENLFDITLNVQTTQKIESSEVSPTSAVALLVDLSASMARCISCGKYPTDSDHKAGGKCATCDKTKSKGNHSGWGSHPYVASEPAKCAYASRMDSAIAAAVAFLTEYAGFDKDGGWKNPGASRFVSLATYDTAANIVQIGGGDWYDLFAGKDATKAQAQAKLNVALEKVKALSSYYARNNGSDSASTRTDAGFAKVESLWSTFIKTNNSVSSRFTVHLTDGKPVQNNGDPGSGYSTPNGYPTSGDLDGGNYKYAAMRANEVRTAYASKVYSVALSMADETIANDWLGYISDKVVTAGNESELVEAFEWVNLLITLAVDAWQVEDPMGENMVYAGYTGTHAGVTAPADSVDKNTLWWNLQSDLTNATFTLNGQGVSYDYFVKNPNENYTINYTLKYQVRLDNLDFGADEVNDYFKTNGQTTLAYYLTKTDNDGKPYFINNSGTKVETKDQALLTLDFSVPAVRSLFGTVSFQKTNGYNNLGDGFEFKLTHASDCACGLTTSKTWTATSNVNGVVTFSNVPSGHNYVLEETSIGTNTGVSLSTDKVPVSISYGAVKIDNSAEAYSFVNTPDAVRFNLTFNKVVTAAPAGATAADEIFNFEVYEADSTFKNLTKLTDKTPSITSTDAQTEGKNTVTISFTNVARSKFGAAGKLYYVVKEVNPANPGNWTYDANEIHFTVEIGDSGNITVTRGNKVKFDNAYTATPGIEVKKTIVTAEDTPIADTKVFQAGERIYYQIDIKATTVDFDSLKVTEEKGFEGPYESLAAITAGTKMTDEAVQAKLGVGETRTLFYYYDVEPTDGPTIVNTVEAQGFTPEGYDNPKDDATATAKVAHPVLSVTKTANKTEYVNGDTIQYTVIVKNTGTVAATGVTFKDVLDDGSTIGNFKINNVAANLTDSFTVPAAADADHPGTVTITYTVQATGLDPASAIAQRTKDLEEATAAIELATKNYEDAKDALDTLKKNKAVLEAEIASLTQQLTNLAGGPVAPGDAPIAPTAPIEPDSADYTKPDVDENGDPIEVPDEDAYNAALETYQANLAQYAIDYDAYQVAMEAWNITNNAYENYDDVKAELEGKLAVAQKALAENKDFDGIAGKESALAKLKTDIDTAIAERDKIGNADFEVKKLGNRAEIEYGPYEVDFSEVNVKIGAVQTAALNLRKTVSPAQDGPYSSSIVLGREGGYAYYRIVASNYGTAAAKVVITDDMTGKEAVSANIGGDTVTEFAFGKEVTIPAGGTLTITYKVEIPANDAFVGEHYPNTATMTFGEDVFEDSAFVDVNPAPYVNLVINKMVEVGNNTWADSKTVYTENQEDFIYRVVVANLGTGTAKFKLSDNKLGTGKVFTDKAMTGEGIDLADHEFTLGATADSNTLTLYYKLTVALNEGKANTVTNTASYGLTNGSDKPINTGADNDDDATVTVMPKPFVKLSIEKKVTLNGLTNGYVSSYAPQYVTADDGTVDFMFRVTVKNSGNAGTFVDVTDVMDGDKIAQDDLAKLEKVYVPADGEAVIYLPAMGVGIGQYTNTVVIEKENVKPLHPEATVSFEGDTNEDGNIFSKADVTVNKAADVNILLGVSKKVTLASNAANDDPASVVEGAWQDSITLTNPTAAIDVWYRITLTWNYAENVSENTPRPIINGNLKDTFDGSEITFAAISDEYYSLDADGNFMINGNGAGGFTFFAKQTGLAHTANKTFVNKVEIVEVGVEVDNPAFNPGITLRPAEDSANVIVSIPTITTTTEPSTGDTVPPVTTTTQPEEEVTTSNPAGDFTTAPADDPVGDEEEITPPDPTGDFTIPATGVLSIPVNPAWTLGTLAVLASMGITLKAHKREEQE